MCYFQRVDAIDSVFYVWFVDELVYTVLWDLLSLVHRVMVPFGHWRKAEVFDRSSWVRIQSTLVYWSIPFIPHWTISLTYSSFHTS